MEKKSRQNTKVKREEIFIPEETNMHKMHNGVMERPIFQLKMDATQFLKSSQRRKANEEVRIANTDPTIRMNSCNEFRQ